MSTMTESITQLRDSFGRGFNWQLFLQDNITGSWMQTATVAVLTLFTAYYTVGRFTKLPVSTAIVLVLWLVGVLNG